MTLKSPYPFFGGKSKVAEAIWERFGDVPNFIDPFFGSGAVLLARPYAPDLELVNDLDGMIVNFWRAVQHDAEQTAYHADYPAFESDLHARHAWLVGRKDSLREALEGDPGYYDAKMAGWWVWGMSLWIGSGFCSGRGAWVVEDGKLVNSKEPPSGVAGQLPKVVDRSLRSQEVRDMAIARKLPYLSTGGMGIQAGAVVGQPPRLTALQGVKRQRIELSGEPKGLHRKRLHLISQKGIQRNLPETVTPRGVATRSTQSGIYAYFDALQERLRRVRVVCGDWTRVISPAVLGAKSPCAILLDPPYVQDGREGGLYDSDEAQAHIDVRHWTLENGDNPDLRIAYCGYEDGFEFPSTWERLNWKANGGYSNQGDGTRKANALRECIWFSPHCLKPSVQPRLFE